MVYGVLRELAQGLANDSALLAWCQSKYGTPPTVMLGVDQKRPPSPEDVPFVAFSTSESTEKGLLTQGTLFFDVIWGVVNESKEADGNLAEYVGARECDEMGELVAKALERVEPRFTAAMGDYTIDLATAWFPLWCGTLNMTLNLRR